MKIVTYDPKKKKRVLCGEVKDDTFVKHVTSKHFMRICQGYGIQEVAIEKLKELGVKKVKIITEVSILDSKLSDWLDHDIKVMDFGNGKQRFLPIKRMKRSKK